VAKHDVVVIGASAGGIEACKNVLRDLSPDLPAAVFIVIHTGSDSPGHLPEVLSRSAALAVHEAIDREPIRPGRVYLAKPDHHLVIDHETVRVIRGPRENRHRPAVDPLFRSAALFYSGRVIGAVLTGALDDGTAGLRAIKDRGGIAIVQDPEEAMFPGMPSSAIGNVEVDFVLPLTEIGAQINRSVQDSTLTYKGSTDLMMELETKMAEMDPNAMQQDERPGKPSAFSCPDCSGVLWEIQDGNFVRFRCRVGHAFAPESMLEAQSHVLEEALWSAMKTLEESARLSRRLADQERSRGNDWLVRRFEEREHDARQRAELIRQVIATDQNATVNQSAP
jgi:two-component system chemotaxis response regulator CheB